MSEKDADIIRWGLDHLLGDMSIFDCCSTATQQNTNGQDVEFVREDYVSEVHTAVENDEVIAHALEEELAQNWSGQPFKNIFSGYEGSPEVVNNMGPSNSCSSTGEKLYEEEVPLELTDDFSSPDGEVGKRLNHVVPVPHVPRINSEIPTVDEAISDHQRLVDRLHVYDLLELKVQGDGNCQFRALSDQFYRSPEHHQFVREQIVNQLKSHPDIYKGYVPMAYDDYLEKMSKYGEWGDHVTLQAAADTYGIKIFVLTSFKDTCYIEILPNVEKSKRVIFLSFWAEVHYNSIYAEGDLPALDTEAQ